MTKVLVRLNLRKAINKIRPEIRDGQYVGDEGGRCLGRGRGWE